MSQGVSFLLTFRDIKPPEDKETGRVRPYILKFSKNGMERYNANADEVEKRLRPGGRFEQMKKWGSKFTGATVRLAGNFHVAEHYNSDPWRKKISENTLETAIQFMDVIADHSTAAFDQMGEDEVMERARVIWEWVTGKWIVRTGKMTFTNRDAQQNLKTRYKTWKVIKEGIDILVERYYLNDLTPDKTRGKLYEVNPKALK